jgi:hypothetical protein
VKVYQREGNALNAARKYCRNKNPKPGDTITQLYWLYDGDQMDASGRIIRKSGRMENVR